MQVALAAIKREQGGVCVVADGAVRAMVPLPIAGLLSDKRVFDVAEEVKALKREWEAAGCTIAYMGFNLIPLSVIPEIRITDRGLVLVPGMEHRAALRSGMIEARSPSGTLQRGAMMHDFCVIGGGIVGLATAMTLLERQPGASLVLIEKEAGFARHQTGHNSGVIHAGVYYAPGSLKAKLCREGAAATKAFCRREQLPFEECGKLLVATSEPELARMDALFTRARENGIDVTRLSGPELSAAEPAIVGLGALRVASTGIVDYVAVCQAMARRATALGAELRLSTPALAIRESAAGVEVDTPTGLIRARKLVACAGLQSDRLARMAGFDIDFAIVPFRGEYFALPQGKSNLIRHLIYPIPDPELPFLGIHLTRMIDGRITVGPNAVLGFAREGYAPLSFDRARHARHGTLPGLLARASRQSGLGRQGISQLVLPGRLSGGVPEILPGADPRRSHALSGRHPGPGRQAVRRTRARLPVRAERAVPARLQCALASRHLGDPDRHDDRRQAPGWISRSAVRSVSVTGLPEARTAATPQRRERLRERHIQ